MSWLEAYARASGMAGTQTPPAPVVVPHGPPVPPSLPPRRQCGMCGDRQALVHNHTCPGPYPVHMDEPCIGPFFDVNGPIGTGPTKVLLVEHCCICLRPCQPIDQERVERWLVGSNNVVKHPNADLLNWEHVA